MVFCTWLTAFVRWNGLEVGRCQTCGEEVATFRKRLCPKGR
jgi:hypothetical protein